MALSKIAAHIYQVSLGFVNVFLIDQDGITVIDAGISGSERRIMAAVRELGKQPSDVRAVLLTHLHADHTGGALALKVATGAKIYMHPADAELFQRGETMRPMQPAPGLVNRLVAALITGRGRPPAEKPAPDNGSTYVDCLISGGEALDFACGLEVIHAPGHTAGHLVFLSPADGGVLFAGDACGRMFGSSLGYSPIYEDFEQGQRTLRQLAGLPFEHAVFGHGKPIFGGAAEQFGRL